MLVHVGAVKGAEIRILHESSIFIKLQVMKIGTTRRTRSTRGATEAVGNLAKFDIMLHGCIIKKGNVTIKIQSFTAMCTKLLIGYFCVSK